MGDNIFQTVSNAGMESNSITHSVTHFTCLLSNQVGLLEIGLSSVACVKYHNV